VLSMKVDRDLQNVGIRHFTKETSEEPSYETRNRQHHTESEFNSNRSSGLHNSRASFCKQILQLCKKRQEISLYV